MSTPTQETYAYQSPIPVRRATLGDALASEWTKIRSVRSTMWTLGTMVLLMLGIGLLTALAVNMASSGGAEIDTSGQTVLSLGFFGTLLGSICVITLGVLTVTSEYTTGMIRPTLTACPARGRVLAAKAIVFAGLVFVLTTVVAGIVAALQTALVDTSAPPTTEAWLRASVGVGLYLSLLGLLAMGVGAIVRHSAGAITASIGLVLLPLVLALFMVAEKLEGVRQALFEYSIPSQLSVLYDNPVTTSGPAGWDPLWIMLIAVAVVLGAAFALLDRRDV
ncbi:ABC transporter permease subunit [Streptomyces sp. NPDC001941]|uniref:ABC transporter permease subunit n=1 Tax=Streptomyces sp. NPDC001941 TaxID=3154659 RepID=UPI003319F848